MKEYIGRDLFDEDGNVVGREYSGELIRCKDCEYDHNCNSTIVRALKNGSVIYCPVQYCSAGKRREE